MRNGTFAVTKAALLALAVALLWTHTAQAQSDLPVTVTCTNDGQGLFSFSFTQSPDYLCSPSEIGLPAYGCIETTQPPGWNATIDTHGWLYWQPTNPPASFDSPLTFTFRSRFTATTTYDAWSGQSLFYKGHVVGWFFSIPLNIGLGGYVLFSFVGPDPTPPPLEIQQVEASHVISWRDLPGGFELETTADQFLTNGWTTVTNAPVSVDGRNYLTNATPAGVQFYRLRGALR